MSNAILIPAQCRQTSIIINPDIAEELAKHIAISGLPVTDERSATRASESMNHITKLLSTGDKTRLSLTSPFREVTKNINDLVGKTLADGKAAKSKLSRSLTNYRREQERLRQVELRKQQEEIQRKLREAEFEAEKEAARLEAIAQEEADLWGEEAEEVITPEPVTIVMPDPVPEVAKVSGMAMRTKIDFEIVDESVALNCISFVNVDPRKVRQFSRDQKDSLLRRCEASGECTISGIKFIVTKTAVSSGR